MTQASVKIESLDDLLGRARKLARLADAGKPIPESFEISFGDPADMLAVLGIDDPCGQGRWGRSLLYRGVRSTPRVMRSQRNAGIQNPSRELHACAGERGFEASIVAGNSFIRVRLDFFR
jgi:hypothetical protein